MHNVQFEAAIIIVIVVIGRQEEEVGGKPPSRIRARPPRGVWGMESGAWLKHLPGGVGGTGYPLTALQTLLAFPPWDGPPHPPPRWRGQSQGEGPASNTGRVLRATWRHTAPGDVFTCRFPLWG